MMRTFIAYCSLIFLVTSCQNPQVRTPTKTSSGSFIEASVARNKLIYKQEKATIETLIKTDSLRDYISSESGFWYTIIQKDSAASKQYPVVGDLITFTYNVKNLAGNVIVSVLENHIIEKRIAITPDIAKKYIALGFEVSLSEKYGDHLGFKDIEYKELGVNISNNTKEIIESANVIVQLGLPSDEIISLFKENQILVGVLDPQNNKEKIESLVKIRMNIFSLELLPRITRAQSMDILSSQANLAGYKAVIESFANFEKAIPMMMTAAGTIPAAKVLVVGAGVAGLQAIATAKRMGAIVFATDVRMASKEQVESLGGKFLTVEDAENLETEGGYAKEASEDFKKKQEELLSETLKKIDIVICTALIPGKKAPVIIKENMISNMKAGSIIYDLAAVQGGNTAFSEVNKVVNKNGVRIMGETNILNKLPISASSLYAKNVFNFVVNLYDKENKNININLDDEIIEKTLIK